MSAQTAAELLESTTGKLVKGFKRIRYALPDGSLGESGSLELALSDGATLHVDSGADGEMLSVVQGPWIDPFGEPVSAVNQAWVRDVGKFTEFGVSMKAPYALLVGQRIVGVQLGFDESERLLEAALQVGPSELAFSSGADVLMVTIDGTEAK